jgi:hypothetical protein
LEKNVKPRKRSKRVRLILLSGMSAGALTGCGPNGPPPVTTDNVYTNNYHLPGVGYYHAPFRDWFKLPYNHYDPGTKSYYYGGKWALEPRETIPNISSPTAQAVSMAEAARTDIVRGGFGGTSSGHGWGVYS